MLDFSKRKNESGKHITFYIGEGIPEETIQEIIYDDTSSEILEKYGFSPITNSERDEFAKIYMKSLSIPISQ